MRLWDVETSQCQMVIQDFNGPVISIAWEEVFNGDYLVTGSNKSIRQWRIVKEGEEYKALLCWSSTQDVLTLRGALIKGVQGLSKMNESLLSQRGAVLA